MAGRRGNRASMSCGEFPWDTIPPHGQFTPAPWTVLHTPPCLSTSPQPQSYSFLRQHRRTPPLPPRFIQFYIPPPAPTHTHFLRRYRCSWKCGTNMRAILSQKNEKLASSSSAPSRGAESSSVLRIVRTNAESSPGCSIASQRTR